MDRRSASTEYAARLLAGLYNPKGFTGMLPSLMNTSGFIKNVEGRDTVTMVSNAVEAVGVIDSRTLCSGQLKGYVFHRNSSGTCLAVSSVVLDRSSSNYDSAALLSGVLSVSNIQSENNAAGATSLAVLDFLPENIADLKSSDLSAFVANSDDVKTVMRDEKVCGVGINLKLGADRLKTAANKVNSGERCTYSDSATATGGAFTLTTVTTIATVFTTTGITSGAADLKKNPFSILTTAFSVTGSVAGSLSTAADVTVTIIAQDAAGDAIETKTNVIEMNAGGEYGLNIEGHFANLARPVADCVVRLTASTGNFLSDSAQISIVAESEGLTASSEDSPVFVFASSGLTSGASLHVSLSGLMDVKPGAAARQNIRVPAFKFDSEFVRAYIRSMISDPLFAYSGYGEDSTHQVMNELRPRISGVLSAGYDGNRQAVIAARGFGSWLKHAFQSGRDMASHNKGIAKDILTIGQIVAPEYAPEMEAGKRGIDIADRIHLI